MFCHLDDCQIVSGYRTDHSGVILKLDFYEQARGKGYWKFNNSLLKDKNLMKDTINEVLSLHVKETNGCLKNNNNNNNSNGSINNNNNSNYHNKEFIINDQLLLETILMMIRGETIKYSSYRKKSSMKKKNSWKKI